MSDIRALIIDQDTATINFLSGEFKKLGINLFAAKTAKEGLILAYQHRPHVIILDPILNRTTQDLKDILQKLKKDWRVSRSPIIAFSSLTDPDEVQAAVNLGFYSFLKKEGGAVSVLIQKTLEAVEISKGGSSKAEQESETGTTFNDTDSTGEGKQGKSIVFLSGKGGIGTSSLCANIAHISNLKLEAKTAVVDLVLPIGSISTIVGLEETANIIEASRLSSTEDIVSFLKKNMQKPSNWNFKFLAGSKSPSHAEGLDISQTFVIIDALKKLSDSVFIDIGKTLSRISLPIIKSADQIVLTLSLDQTTVEHTKAVWNFLKEQGVEQNQIYFLINRAVGLEGLPKSEVESILGSVIQLAVPYMGSNFTLSNNLHQPVSDKFPQDAVSISLRQASEEIFRRIEQRTTKMDFF